MLTFFLTMNRSEQEHLYRQSRQVSIIQSSPVLADQKDDLLLSVLNSPLTDNRRKSSSVLLKPNFLSGKLRRNSQKSVLDGQFQYIDKDVRDAQDRTAEDSADDLDSDGETQKWLGIFFPLLLLLFNGYFYACNDGVILKKSVFYTGNFFTNEIGNLNRGHFNFRVLGAKFCRKIPNSLALSY